MCRQLIRFSCVAKYKRAFGEAYICASEAMQILRLIDFKIYKFQLEIALIQKPEADASGFYFTISNIILIIVC